MHYVTTQAPNTVENYKVKCCLGKKNQRKHTNLEQNQVKTGHGKNIMHILPSYPTNATSDLAENINLKEKK